MSPRASAKKPEDSDDKPAASATKKATGTTKKTGSTTAKKATGTTKKTGSTTAKKATGTTKKTGSTTAKKATSGTAKKAGTGTAKKASGTTKKTTGRTAAKKATAAAEPEVESAAAPPPESHDEHEHGHDHEGHEHDDELSEEEQAQAEADLEQMARALSALDDDTLRGALAGMSEKSRQEVATHLQLPRATMHLGDALMPIVRRKLATTHPDHQLQVLFALAQHANDQTIELLGKRAEDPTKEDLLEVLPTVVDAHGPELVTLMLAGYTASDAVCRPVMRDILETDDRFVIGEPVPVEAKPELGALPEPTLSKAELDAKREQRAAKDAKRQAELHAREARANAQAKRRQAVHDAKRKAR
jgi:hypothetical protein